MYTIKHAAEQVGITADTLRAWERRYGIVSPQRTDGGYRVYTEDDVRVLQSMRELVDEGWAPSLAAREAARRPERSREAPVFSGASVDDASGKSADADQVFSAPFVAAAGALDATALGSVLDEMFAVGSFEAVVKRHLFPALTALGDAWAAGRVSVAGEHFASHTVMRRVAAAYDAAATFGQGPRVLLGMAPGSRHELGLFAFAVAARRRGLNTDYLGADLPVADWASASAAPDVGAVVVAVPTTADIEATHEVVTAIRERRPDVLVAAGGAEQEQSPEGVLRLGDDIFAAAKTLAETISTSVGPRSATSN